MNDLTPITQKFGDLSRWMECPPYWVAKPDMAGPLIKNLKKATVRPIGTSAGGREIIANFVHNICGCGKDWTIN